MGKREAADPRPRYRQVADELMTQLRSGRHPVGAMLPTETELCAQYAVSRHTIREALRLLEEAGLVARRQGSGTTVIAQEGRGRFVQDISTMAELLQYPAETRLTVLRAREVEVDAATAAHLGISAGETWLCVMGIRRVRVTDAPICYVTLMLRPEHASVLDDIGVETRAVYALIERRFGLSVSAIELDLSACGVPEEQARMLEVDTGAPALLIRRRYMDEQGRVFEVSEATHPAPRFTYRATLKREAG